MMEFILIVSSFFNLLSFSGDDTQFNCTVLLRPVYQESWKTQVKNVEEVGVDIFPQELGQRLSFQKHVEFCSQGHHIQPGRLYATQLQNPPSTETVVSMATLESCCASSASIHRISICSCLSNPDIRVKVQEVVVSPEALLIIMTNQNILINKSLVSMWNVQQTF